MRLYDIVRPSSAWRSANVAEVVIIKNVWDNSGDLASHGQILAAKIGSFLYDDLHPRVELDLYRTGLFGGLADPFLCG